MSNTSRYVGNGRWDWTVFVEGNATTIARIKCVEYTLHPTFPNPVRLVCDRGKGTQAFPLSSNGWGEFTINARVIRQDGGVQPLSYRLRLQPEISKATASAARATLAQEQAAAAPSQQGIACPTLITLTARERSVVRVGQLRPPVFAYAGQANDDGSLPAYLISTTKTRLFGTGLQEQELLAMLAKLGIRQSSVLTPETYLALTLKPGQSARIPTKEQMVLTPTSSRQSGSVDLSFCVQD